MSNGAHMARLKEKYRKEIIGNLKTKFQYENVHQVPRLEKIVLNMGVGEAVKNSKVIDGAVKDMTMIAGQKAVTRKARKSIANFKLREGLAIGVSVTLRNDRMYEFLDRLVHVALPRVRDFKGIPKNAFDGRGNYTLGLTDQLIFPEIDIEKTTSRGMNVTFVTSANTNAEGEALLREFGLPLRQ